MIAFTKEQTDMILTALEVQRIKYQRFYHHARSVENYEIMEKYAKKVTDYRDLICKIVEGREAGDIA